MTQHGAGGMTLEPKGEAMRSEAAALIRRDVEKILKEPIRRREERRGKRFLLPKAAMPLEKVLGVWYYVLDKF